MNAWIWRGAIIGAVGIASTGANALSLTGICGFPTDDAGNWHTGWYNTFGPDAGKNAYVVVGPNVNGAFVNSGNGAPTQVSIDLSTPGDYTLFAFFDGNEMTPGRDFWGINLFFDGNGSTPGISAFAKPQWANEAAPPAFSANTGTTLDLTASHAIAGSGSLTYSGSGATAVLSRYATTANVYSLDRVNNFALGASGRNDHVAVIGLHVVPEPASVAALGLGVVSLIRRRRKA